MMDNDSKDELVATAEEIIDGRDVEIERLRAALQNAPRPSTEKAWVLDYVDWYFQTRISALEQSTRKKLIVECARCGGPVEFGDCCNECDAPSENEQLRARLHTLETVVRDAAEAIDRGSTSAPVAEALWAAIGGSPEQSTPKARRTYFERDGCNPPDWHGPTGE